MHWQCYVLTSDPRTVIEGGNTAGATEIRVTSIFVSHMTVVKAAVWFTKQFSQHELWCDGDVSSNGI